MEKRITTRITALTAALAVIVSSAASCGKENNNKNEKKNAQELLSASYRPTEIETDIDFANVRTISKMNDGNYVINTLQGSENGGNATLYVTDKDFSSFKPVELDLGIKDAEETNILTSVSPDGDVMAIVQFTETGDIEKPNFDDPNFDARKFDFEEYRNSLKVSYKIYNFDINGKKLAENDLVGVNDEEDGGMSSINNMLACGNGKAMIQAYGGDEKNLVVNADGKVEKTLNFKDFSWIDSYVILSDGSVAITGMSKNNEYIRTLDNKTFDTVGEDIQIDGIDENSLGALISGDDIYKFYSVGSTGIFGIKEDGKATEVVNWIDSDLSGGNVSAAVPVGNDEFIVFYNDWDSGSDGKSILYRLKKCDKSELENTKVITIGVMNSDWELSQKVSDFNKSHDDVRIKVEDYSKYEKYDQESGTTITSGLGQLKKDIVSGKAPDIIVSDNTGMIHSLQNKGLFVDLYELMDKDSELKKEDIMPNILKASEVGGKLYSIATSFTIETNVAKKKFVETPDWTIDQMIETYKKLPEGMKLTPIDCKEQILMMIIYSLNECIDYEKGTCNFDTPEFNKLIEFCEEFPSQDEIIDWEDPDSYESLTSDDNYINDKVLVYELYLSDLNSYIREIKGALNNEPVTFVGYPSNNGHGGILTMNQNFSILSNASDKDACWSFIKEFFKPAETDEDFDRMYGFPSLKSDFEKLADKAMKKPTYTDENGKTVEEDITYTRGDKEVVLQPLTKEERDLIVDYIENVSRTAFDFDPEVESILEEEFMGYMNGEKTAKEALDLIQSRVSLLVSEQS